MTSRRLPRSCSSTRGSAASASNSGGGTATWVTRCAATSSSSGSRIGRGRVTMPAPTLSGAESMSTRPIAWKNGAPARTTDRSSKAPAARKASAPCAAAAARLPCVMRTPLGRPPVPLENGTAARSSGCTSGSAYASPAPSASSASIGVAPAASPPRTARSTSRRPAVASAARTVAAKGAKAIAARGTARASTRADSSAVHSGLNGETAAPARHTPSATTGHHARLGIDTATRSPGRTPPARRPAARAAERAASSPRVSVSPVAPSTTATAAGSAAAWRRKAVGTAGSSAGAGSGLRWTGAVMVLMRLSPRTFRNAVSFAVT